MMLPEIAPLDCDCRDRAQAMFDGRAKPLGSLGRLEELVGRLAAIQRRVPPTAHRPRIILFAADHGVARFERVSAYPWQVTASMLSAYAAGRAAISVLARHAGASLDVVDVGVHGAERLLPGLQQAQHVRIERRAVRDDGSANIATESAMDAAEFERCVQIGVETAERAHDEEIDVLVLGEMGIGNTTAASAVVARLLGLSAERVVGPGAGLDVAGVQEKKRVVGRVLERSRQRDLGPLEILADVGGLELAALAGCLLKAAERRIPVLLDGFIVSAAALAAVRHAPLLRDFLIPATCSAEPAHGIVLEAIGAGAPLISLGLRLGEGSAAALALPLVQAGCRLLAEMASLQEVIDGSSLGAHE